jgi:ribosomal protein S18 acetylase RimI-like enzyme
MAEETGHLLDNPIWNALTTDHAALAVGSGMARRYPVDIGPLSGIREETEAGWAALEPLGGQAVGDSGGLGSGGVVVVFLRGAPRIPDRWTLVRGGVLVQMVAEEPTPVSIAEPKGVTLRVLTAGDAPAMVELAQLTEPGPFRLRTMELGTFFGIFEERRLLAMAGKRLHVPGYVEVSGVCTHPEARGRGYARLLMSCVMEEIAAEGKKPFLHSFAQNYGAIRVYEDLGFRVRRSFELAVAKNQGTGNRE